MDRLDAMSVLQAVVDAGSLSAAARRLGMPLATVSRKISDLEAHLKTRLFTRTSRRMVLTDAGQVYVAASRRILEQVCEAERAAAGEFAAPRGDLVVAAPIVFGRRHVLPVALDFLKAYPRIDLRLQLSDRIAHLLDDHIDAALRIGDLPDSGFIAAKLGTVRRVVCASPAYFAARGRPKTLADLAAHDGIVFDGLASPQAWVFGAGKTQIAVAIHARLAVNTAEAAIDAAIAGAGIARVLSYQAVDAVRAGALELVLTAIEPAPAPVHLMHAGRGAVPRKLRAFLDFAAPRLKARLTEIAGL